MTTLFNNYGEIIMTKTVVFTSAVLAAAMFLTGCAGGISAKSSTVSVNPPVHPLNELRSIAVEARDELRLLAKTVDATNSPSLSPEQHAQKHFQATHVPAGFERQAQFSYTGNASVAAKALADMAGYKFKTQGLKLSNEPWVSIHIKNQPLSDALRELGLQTGSGLRIEVHEAARLMLVVYPK